MEALCIVQDNNLSTITKTLINLKKTPKARLTCNYIKVRLENLEKYWESFQKTHNEILKVATQEQRKNHDYFNCDIFYKCEEEYICAKCELVDVLESLQPQHTLQQIRNSNGEKNSNQEVKLPKISIPQFDGNYNNWNTFHDLYMSIIHLNTSLSNIQKMHYLKTNLTGEAEQLLKHIPIADKNYEVAWNTLKERYNNRRVIVNTIFNRLLSQKKLNLATAKGIKDLLDTTTECLNNLTNNNVVIDNWDPIMIHITVNKLDQESHKEWEEELKNLPVQELPTWKKFQDFLGGKFRVLEMIQPIQTKERPNLKTKSFYTSAPQTSSSETLCAYCQGDHLIFKCQEFTKLDPTKRSEFVKNERLCFNCLWPGHSVSYCRKNTYCHKCRRKHHTLLHENKKSLPTEKTDTEKRDLREENATSTHILSHVSTQSTVTLLATALVNIRTSRGEQTVRALIDPCSQESFISESTAQRLQLRKREVEGQVTGVGKMATPIKHAVELEITSRLNHKFKLRCTAFVIQQVTEIMPATKINNQRWVHFKGLQLADPSYNNPGPIDILLGVNIYTEILMTGIIKGNPGEPSAVAQQTQLGWIISGGAQSENPMSHGIVSMHLNVSLDHMLQRFWEIETLETNNNALTTLEVRAEEIYEKTLARQDDGRYIVSLPFRTDNPSLPKDSRAIALRRFKSLEKRLDSNRALKEEYNKVLQEYLTLNHMEPVITEQIEMSSVYLPHHAVIREDKETSKVRVVFDASCRGSNGISLNEELLIGPSLQEELRNIIIRWRIHKICFVADIIKMYRQIRLRPEDKEFHRILYRFNPDDEVRDYRLLTVTFGTACAPYLAMKTLKQVAKDETKDGEFPLAKDIILRDFYMDDVLSGCDNVQKAIEMQKQLTALLKRGGFELQKWSSNSKTFLQTLEPDKRAKLQEVDMNRKESIKTLGIIWEIGEDNLKIAQKNCFTEFLTKRNVLRHIASLFDPMGWLAPAVMVAKIFMQRLWIRKLDWDEELPDDLKDEWNTYQNNLPCLSKIRIDRWVGYCNNCMVELHGFSDASLAGYAAVVYLRILNSDGTPKKVSLITAKTKVAPVKAITLPRLELCGAALLAKLVKHVMKTLQVKIKRTYAWTDSKIVLAWIKGDPNRWSPFVKNRVIEIQNDLDSYWSYVNTKENPADPASRGICPSKMKTCDLWWQGPQFLYEDVVSLPREDIPETEEEKRISIKCAVTNLAIEELEPKTTLLSKFSSLQRLLNVVAYCRRWKNLKERKKLPKHISSSEKEEALTICLKIAQEIEFPEEIVNLQKEKVICRSSKLLPLNPYLDKDGIVRVGGRLKHANIEFNRKHPIILTKDNVLLPLLLREAHIETLHGGPQLMTTYLKSKYWIIKGGQSVKRYYRQCKLCARYNATTGSQMMGDLPDVRVNPSRPFSISGVDFAGPISSRMSKGRGAKTHKSYICLFICMATKAIHLELVSDMTTAAYIASFKRFVSRRGHCKELWSDHGTTFVASEKALLDMWKQGINELPAELQQFLDKRGTRWKYIPPGAPNFGGLWEAGVKSTKYHLKRILKNSTLTFEELYTVLTQIEACLNSRPLTALGEDLDYLTPGHFLVGEPMITIPDRSYEEIKITNLTRWQLTQRMLRDFWTHWQAEFLSRLQQRPKWLTPKKDLEIGQLVLIKDSRLPPGDWQLGRVMEKYTGKDELTRIYDVRTSTGVKQRSISKLCHLPD